MPANRSNLGDWNPSPDFASPWSVEPSVDERVFNMYSETDVAHCILETSEVGVYEWMMTTEQLEQLALESAKRIIGNRRNLLMEQQVVMARTRRDELIKLGSSKRTMVTVGFRENPITGEPETFSNEQILKRSVG